MATVEEISFTFGPAQAITNPPVSNTTSSFDMSPIMEMIMMMMMMGMMSNMTKGMSGSKKENNE